MPLFTRLNKKKVSLSDEKIRSFVAMIKQKPGLKVSDYVVLCANAGIFVSQNRANLILECTESGREVIRKGMVARTTCRGQGPAWHNVSGVKFATLSKAYRPAVFKRGVELETDLEVEIKEDAETIMDIASSAIFSTQSPRRTIHELDTLREIVQATAMREDSRAKKIVDYKDRLQQLTAQTAEQARYIDALHTMDQQKDTIRRLTSRLTPEEQNAALGMAAISAINGVDKAETAEN